MWPESSGRMELDDATRPGGDGWPGDDAADGRDAGWPGDDAADEPDPDWPGDDAADEPDPDWPGDWPDEGGDDPPWRRAAPPAAYGRDRGPGWRGVRPLALAAVAVVALGAGVGVALAVRGLDNSASPSAASGRQQPNVAPGGGGAVPGGGTAPGGGNRVTQMFVAGPVTAVSAASITIGGGPSQSVTAAVTSSTKVTGQVSSIGAVKVGDDVSAQITVSGGRDTATAIQDPAQAPSAGGSLP